MIWAFISFLGIWVRVSRTEYLHVEEDRVEQERRYEVAEDDVGARRAVQQLQRHDGPRHAALHIEAGRETHAGYHQ